jgi:beta-lactamase class A
VTPGPFSRRALLVALPALACAGVAMAADDAWAQLPARFAELEKESGGRLGVAALDIKSGRSAAHRGDERFPLTSTFKFLAAAAVLARVDAGADALDKVVAYTQADLVTYSPVTKDFAGKGLRLDAICDAAITLSDNTAGNLLLRELGGPEGLTRYMRSIGDGVTRLDRWETALNEALPDDLRDTTTPNAMVENLRRLALGDALKPGSRQNLNGWLQNCKTSADRMRADLPPGWIVGDKTGAGERGTMNDVGVITPPDGAPILLAIYLTASEKPQAARAKIHSEAGRLVASAARP